MKSPCRTRALSLSLALFTLGFPGIGCRSERGSGRRWRGFALVGFGFLLFAIALGHRNSFSPTISRQKNLDTMSEKYEPIIGRQATCRINFSTQRIGKTHGTIRQLHRQEGEKRPVYCHGGAAKLEPSGCFGICDRGRSQCLDRKSDTRFSTIEATLEV